MAISDKTRKILWGRSGNRCAVCKHELVVDATHVDDESIVGEECHIVSNKVQGPRFDPGLETECLDEAENLILLCRVHHKMVDDQAETYSVAMLRDVRANHEKWVSSALTREKCAPAVTIRRVKENIPTHLVRLMSGQDVLGILEAAHSFSFEHDEPRSGPEVELLSGFLQEAQDWGELDLEAGDRVKAAFRISSLLQELEQAGFWVFGGREVQRVEGGVGSPSPWPVGLLRIFRSTNPEIIKVKLSDEGDQSKKPSR